MKQENCTFCEGTGQIVSSTTISGFKTCDCINIPQEEPKQETLEDLLNKKANQSSKVDLNAYANGLDDGAKWQAERVDREIEEAAANLADPNICKTDNWIAGAKYQAERMYSEEEVIAIVEKSRATGLTAEYLLLTEQFKKK